jgi:hypothetical protein
MGSELLRYSDGKSVQDVLAAKCLPSMSLRCQVVLLRYLPGWERVQTALLDRCTRN